jgi:predicted transcriptional regulator YdeE
MINQCLNLPELTLLGLSVRTNNKNEIDPKTGKIGPLATSYWGNQSANAIKHRAKPGLTYAVYTDYERDEHGEYTCLIGEEVRSIEGQDRSTFDLISIPHSRYQKFTTLPGKMPDVIIAAWQEIWSMKPEDFAAKRTYIADFELYDQRAADPNHAVVDIYIGIAS